MDEWLIFFLQRPKKFNLNTDGMINDENLASPLDDNKEKGVARILFQLNNGYFFYISTLIIDSILRITEMPLKAIYF